MINAKDLREVIQAVLHGLDLEIPYSEEAVELLMLTAAQESKMGTYLKQMKDGPARGIFQMEPNTEKDIYENFLRYKPNLKHLVEGYKLRQPGVEGLDLWMNIPYQVAMARVHYFRVKKPLPKSVGAWAKYWKKYYNTHLGKGTWEEAEGAYLEHCS